MKHFFIVVIRCGAGTLAVLAYLAAPALVSASVSVAIEALSPNANLTVGQSVSFNVVSSGFVNPAYSISDSLSGSSITHNDVDSSGDFAWTPGSADVGTHNLTITVSDSQGDTATTQETLTVSAPASVSIGAVSPSATVIVGQAVSFTASATGFTNPGYSVSDSFSGSSVTSGNISSSGQFTWTPVSSAQDGTHTITVYVTDSSGHNSQASETITVQSAPALTIQSLLPGANVNPGQTVTFTASPSNFSSTPTYTLSDTYGGSSIVNPDINSSGNFSWIPTQNDDGTHTITIIATDSSGHFASATQTIAVGGTPVGMGASVQGFTSGSTVIVGQPITFTIAVTGFANPVFSIGDSFGGGSSVSNSDVNSTGHFSWTPGNSDVGTHTLTIYVNDSSGHTANTTVTVTVAQASLSINSIEPGTTIAPNTPLTFTVSPQGFTNPSYTVRDSFSGTSLSNSAINSSGQFAWTPIAGDTGAHTITIYATDPSGHSANTSIIVNVGSGTPAATAASGSSLSQLETELQAQESRIASLGGSTGGPTTSYVFSGTISPGMSGVEVTQLQTTLAQQGDFSGSATGYYGALTTAAVEKFQAAHGIAQLGVVGPETLAALNALMVPQTSSSTATGASASATTGLPAQAGDGYVFSNFIGYGYTGTDVTELQKRLTAFGVYAGPITGHFGSLTQTAVKAFQADHGIKQAGYVGPSTRGALNQ